MLIVKNYQKLKKIIFGPKRPKKSKKRIIGQQLKTI